MYYFFVKPLNNMANLNVIITTVQFLLCFACLFVFIAGTDEWVLGLIGMAVNAVLILFQFVRMFKTRRFIDDYLKVPTNHFANRS
jgi:O-antigen/teichoic acid export membrane protein